MISMNKTVLISGGTSGIGKVAVLQLLKEGFAVSTFSSDASKCEALKAELALVAPPVNFSVSVADVRKEEDCLRVVAETVKHFGGLDILVNNAGCGYFPSSDEVVKERFEDMLAVNLVGLTMLTKHVIPHMKKRGSGLIINISSISGKVGFAGSEFYNATKFAVLGYSEGLRLELKPFGVKVSTVCPGEVATNFLTPVEVERRMQTRWGGKRPVMLEALDVARIISFISNQSEHSNVQDVLVMPF